MGCEFLYLALASVESVREELTSILFEGCMLPWGCGEPDLNSPWMSWRAVRAVTEQHLGPLECKHLYTLSTASD